MIDFGNFYLSWNFLDYNLILLFVAALFMFISSVLRTCGVHKKSIDLSFYAVVAILLVVLIKLFTFKFEVVPVFSFILAISAFAVALYVLIDNAAASMAEFDKARQRIYNSLWCCLFYAVVMLNLFIQY